jgi:DNA-binding protein HU-beta
MTALNKGTFTDALAAELNVSKAEAGRVLDGFLNVVTANLKEGNDIGFTGFGAFKVTDRPAREGRNPANGETIKIAASKAVRFSMGAGLKTELNEKKAKKK